MFVNYGFFIPNLKVVWDKGLLGTVSNETRGYWGQLVDSFVVETISPALTFPGAYDLADILVLLTPKGKQTLTVHFI